MYVSSVVGFRYKRNIIAEKYMINQYHETQLINSQVKIDMKELINIVSKSVLIKSL